MHKIFINFIISLFTFILFTPAILLAGPNASAICSIDMDITTSDYGKDFKSNIEPYGYVNADQTFTIAIVAQNVINLDTYQFDVIYDPKMLEFLNAYEDDIYVTGLTNILKKNDGKTLGFSATKTDIGIVCIANTLVGAISKQAPEGSGIIAVIKFKKLQDGDSIISLGNVNFVDSNKTHDKINKREHGKIK